MYSTTQAVIIAVIYLLSYKLLGGGVSLETERSTASPQTLHGRLIKKLFNRYTPDISFCFVHCENGSKQQKTIDAHKTLLSTLSPVFRIMFSRNWKESISVEIKDASFDVFNAFIEYFYSEQIAISAENVVEILYLAHKYDVPELLLVCSTFLLENVTVDVVVICLTL